MPNRQDAPTPSRVHPLQLQQTQISWRCFPNEQLSWQYSTNFPKCIREANSLPKNPIDILQEAEPWPTNNCLRPLLWNPKDLRPSLEKGIQTRDPIHRFWNPWQIYLYGRCPELPKVLDGLPRYNLCLNVSKAWAANLPKFHKNDQSTYRRGKEVCQ